MTPNARDPLPPSLTSNVPSDFRSEIVVAGGSLTTLLALAGVFAAARSGENIMGWYANYVIPAGALLVGLVAASGYGIAAWMTGLKMTKRLMWSVVGQLAVAYFIAQYEQYRTFVPEGGGFWSWLDEATRGIAWKQHDGHLGEPLGLLGYGLRALELAGFVCGGVLVPLGLRQKPYCDPCRTYKRTRLLAVLPAGVKRPTFGKVPPADHFAAQKTALDGVAAIYSAARDDDRARFEHELLTRGPLGEKRSARGKSGHAVVNLVRCPRCSDAHLAASMIVGQGQNIRITPLSTQPLQKDRVPALFD